MSEKEKPFSAPRWNEESGTKVIGYKKQTEEERKKSKEMLDKILKDEGIKK